jgi:hypothetical protein
MPTRIHTGQTSARSGSELNPIAIAGIQILADRLTGRAAPLPRWVYALLLLIGLGGDPLLA